MPDTAEISATLLLERFRFLSLVAPESAEISEMLRFALRFSVLKLVNLASAETSDTLLRVRFSVLSFFKPESAEV